MKVYHKSYNVINSIPPFSGVRVRYPYDYKFEDRCFYAICRKCGKCGRCTCRVTDETDGFRYRWETFEMFDIDRRKLIIGNSFSCNAIPRCPGCHSRQIEITEYAGTAFGNGGLDEYTAKSFKQKIPKILKTLRNRIGSLSRSVKHIPSNPGLDIVVDIVYEFSDTDRV